MSKPENSIKKINSSEIIPDRLGSGSYTASLPTLTADATILTNSDVSEATYIDIASAITSDTNSIPSTKAVYDYGEAIRTIAEGKCKSYTISYANNTSFNSQSAYLSSITSFVDTAGNTIQTSSLKNGDIVLVIETDVPDRWYSSADSKFYILETAKVDLSNYMTTENPTGIGSLSLNRKANTTIGVCSVAEGNETTASGYFTHAEGGYTTASGAFSHAEGNDTSADGNVSHAEGYGTTASGDLAHAEGNETVAQRKSQHVFGEYNIADTTGTVSTRGKYAEIVGNGTADNARSNARTLDWDGNEEIAGGLTIGTNATIGDGTNSITVANIINKIDKPSTVGTAGQVLGLDSNLSPVWTTPSGGGGGSGSSLYRHMVMMRTSQGSFMFDAFNTSATAFSSFSDVLTYLSQVPSGIHPAIGNNGGSLGDPGPTIVCIDTPSVGDTSFFVETNDGQALSVGSNDVYVVTDTVIQVL